MSGMRALVPVEVAARARALGRVPFGFGPRFFVALLLGFLCLVPSWWAPRMIGAMVIWDLVRLPAPEQMEGRRSWEHAASLADSSDITIAVHDFGRVAARCTAVDEAAAG